MGKVHIVESKGDTEKRKGRFVELTGDGAVLFDRMIAKKAPDALIFTHITLRRTRAASENEWLPYDQRQLMENAYLVAEIEPVVFHELRHTYASMLINMGCPRDVLAKQLGHQNTDMINLHYGKLYDEYVASAVNKAYPETGILEDPPMAKIERLRPKTG
jgi:integrase